MKDALVITTSGAEVIPFIKVWVMLPTAVLLTFVFTRLSSRFSQERVFYIMISGFLIFFALFAYVLYPLKSYLHPTELAHRLNLVAPAGFKGFIAMCCHWSFTIFYVMSELWSTMILTVLFWGFANEISTVQEARRYYGVLGVAASISAVFAGQAANMLGYGGSWHPNLPFIEDPWAETMLVLVSVVIVLGIVTMFIFRWMSRNVLTDPSFDQFHFAKKAMKAKGKKLSIKESFRYISNSKYLLFIAILVVAYNLVINMSEVAWKDQLVRLVSNPNDYNVYMNNLTSVIGIIATLTALFMAKIIEKIGWTWTAMITPLLMGITCTGFFTFLLFPEYLSSILYGAAAPLSIAVFFGSAQNCLSKAAKYSVFDATKEMAFIPLGHESKLKGKAAIDGVGSRLGKSGGSILYQGLLMTFASVTASTPYVAAILATVIVLWIIAVRGLGRQFDSLVDKTPADTTAPKKAQEGSLAIA